MVKVALVGTSGNGKTTLLNACQARYGRDPEFATVAEVARDFFLSHTDLGNRYTYEVQGTLVDLIVAAERRQAARFILCDRSVLDAVAYLVAADDVLSAERMFKRIERWLPTYSRFLLLDPRDVIYVQDPVRSEDPVIRLRLHEAFARVLDRYKLPHDLVSGSLAIRLAYVDATFRSLGYRGATV